MKRLYFTIAAMFSLLSTMASGITIEAQTDQLLLGDSLRFSIVAPEVEFVNVELVAPEGYVLEFERLYMKDGCAKGAFYMRPLLLSGLYELRAYIWEDVEADSTDYASRVVAVYQREGDRATILARKRPYLKRIGQRLSLRPFSTEELALLDVETVCGLPCTNEEPSYYEKRRFHSNGLKEEKPYTHSIITTTVDAERRWARAFKEYGTLSLGSGYKSDEINFLLDLLLHWQYRIMPLRIISLESLPEGDAVPVGAALIDNLEISLADYDICEAYSYSKRPVSGYGRDMEMSWGVGLRATGRPGIVICLVRKKSKE